MGEDGQSNRVRNRGPSSVGIGYLPCAFYCLSQQAGPRTNRSEGPCPEDDVLQGKHRDTPDIGCGLSSEDPTPGGTAVPSEKDSAGQHDDEDEQT